MSYPAKRKRSSSIFNIQYNNSLMRTTFNRINCLSKIQFVLPLLRKEIVWLDFSKLKIKKKK